MKDNTAHALFMMAKHSELEKKKALRARTVDWVENRLLDKLIQTAHDGRYSWSSSISQHAGGAQSLLKCPVQEGIDLELAAMWLKDIGFNVVYDSNKITIDWRQEEN